MSDSAPATGFLTLVNESLSFHPERADLWMARFDVLRSLGYKREFANILTQALLNGPIRKQLDWKLLRSMWEEVAPGEPFPTDAQEQIPSGNTGIFPAFNVDDPPPPDAVRRPAPAPAPARKRRFNDIAVSLAGPQLQQLAKDYNAIAMKPGFFEDFTRKTRALLRRPTPLEYSERLSRGAGVEKRIYLKREDLRGVPVEAEHAAAQCYIGSLLGRKHVVTANDVDLHALEVATVAPFFGMTCNIVVRPGDLKARADLVEELRALGAQVAEMPAQGMLGTDPREGAVRFWNKNPALCHLALSLGMAPAPYTAMANAFQSLVGKEAERQYTEMASLLRRPHTLVAAVGSEADSIGFALPFLNRKDTPVAYAEPPPGGRAAWRPSARLKPYNGLMREHSWLHSIGRIQYVPVPDADAETFRQRLAQDGIKLGLEDARAVALTAVLGQGDPTPRDYLVLVG